MRADKVMVWIIIGVIVVVGMILLKNRGSDKIFAALVVILTTTLTTGLGSLLLILRPESQSREFSSVFIYDTKANKPILSECYPIRKRFMDMIEIWSQSKTSATEGKNEVPSDLPELLTDFLARSMVEHLVKLYNKAWSIQITSWSVPGADQTSWGPTQDAARLPKIEVPIDELLKILQTSGNRFASIKTTGSSVWNVITLPPGTRFSCVRNPQVIELRLKNHFADVAISITFTSMGALQHNYYDVFEVNPSEQSRYYQVSFRVKTEANYSSWRAGWEMMTHHKRWAQSIMESLRDNFDWELCDREIKDSWMTKQLATVGRAVGGQPSP